MKIFAQGADKSSYSIPVRAVSGDTVIVEASIDFECRTIDYSSLISVECVSTDESTLAKTIKIANKGDN